MDTFDTRFTGYYGGYVNKPVTYNEDALQNTNPKDKIGETKPSLALVPTSLLVPLSEVMKLGAKKYGAWNWRNTNPKAMVYYNAMLRHIHAALDREDTDPESRQSHLAHVSACCLILLDSAKCGNLIDDRPPKN